MTFIQALENAKEILKGGLTHGRYPFNLYSEELKQNNIDAGMLLNYSIVSNSWKSIISMFWNWAMLNSFAFPYKSGPDDQDGLQRIRIEYRYDCFSDEKIDSLVDSLLTMLRDMVNNPEIACDEISIWGATEKRLINAGMATLKNSFAYQEAQKYFEKIFAGNEIDSNLIPDLPGEKDRPLLASYTLNGELPLDDITCLAAFAYTLANIAIRRR